MNWTFTPDSNNYIDSYYELIEGDLKAKLVWDSMYSYWRMDLYQNNNNQWDLIDNQQGDNPATLRGVAENIIFLILTGQY